MSLIISTDPILTKESLHRKRGISFNFSKAQKLTEKVQQREEPLPLSKQQRTNEQIYDIELLENPSANSKIIRRLRSELRLQFLGEHRKYQFIKRFAVERLKEKIWQQINVLFNLNQCPEKNKEPDAAITNGVYSWTLEEFLKRRMIGNHVWIDVMLKSPEVCLDKFKFRKDLEELQKCIEYLFEGLFSNIDEATSERTDYVVQYIRNINQLLEFCNNLGRELRNNRIEHRELVLIDLTFGQVQLTSGQRFTAMLLQLQINNNFVFSPIEIRCQFAWYQAYTNQRLIYKNIVEDKLSKAIATNRNKRMLEKAFANNCMDYFYTTIDNIKSFTNSMQVEYEEETEKIDNSLIIKRIRLEKLRDKRKLLGKELIRFREEIEERRIKEEAEAAEKEKIRLEEEEIALAEKLINEQRKKSKKGKKRKSKVKK